MIKVCDMPTGFGKSSSCINYMNSHPENRYIYATPYVDETVRIARACPQARFYRPNRISPENHHSVTQDTLPHLLAGENIATTHQAFLYYTKETQDAIRAGGYTLMLDESVNILEGVSTDKCDIDILVLSGFIANEDGNFRIKRDDYTGRNYKEMMRKLRSRDMVEVDDEGGMLGCAYWVLSIDLIKCFKNIIIMTYQFPSQDLYYYLKLNGVQFKYIGVDHDDAGYHFNMTELDEPHKAPGMGKYRDLIHICDSPKRNAVGNNRNALSMNWFAKNKEGMKKLKTQINYWFRYDMKQYGEKYRLVGTYADEKWWKKIRDKGYMYSMLNFNTKATNNYSDRRVLVYACNVFLPWLSRTYFKSHGIDISEDQYALSTMIQWIWRSAIRNDEEIWIYIPSRRMRELLQGWLDEMAGIPRSKKSSRPSIEERRRVLNEEAMQRLPVG